MNNHIIIKSSRNVYHRLDKNLLEVSLKTGKSCRYGLIFQSLEDITNRGFEIIEEIPVTNTYKFGYWE